MNGDSLSTAHDKDLARLKQGRRNKYVSTIVKGFAGILGLLAVVLVIICAVNLYSGEDIDPSSVRVRLASVEAPWAETMLRQYDRYRLWLADHGTQTELSIFENVSIALAQSALSGSGAEHSDSLGFFGAVYVSVHLGLQRLVFFLVAASRLWIVCTLVACVMGALSLRVHRGKDFLGAMGNGRMYYSGVRATLDKVTSRGAPDLQVTGLAVTNRMPIPQTKVSSLYRTLEKFHAVNETNTALVSIINSYPDWISYVAQPEEDKLLAGAFKGPGLGSHAEEILSAVMTLHSRYISGDTVANDATPEIPRPMTGAQYAELLGTQLNRVVTPEMRECLTQFSPEEMATIVLSMQAGKILAFAYEGGRWTKQSNFPELSARAILHSLPEYATEYSFDQRMGIRRALIYASRKSAFAPVRVPVDLSDKSWAARQWVELLLACPHEIEAVADEVEMAGLVRQAHNRFLQEFLEGGAVLTPDFSTSSFVTQSNLVFVPLKLVVGILKRTLNAQLIERLSDLISVISVRQKLLSHTQAGPDWKLPQYEKVTPLFTEAEIKSLTEKHALTVDEISDWSALRIVLNSSGWLARRVGDYTVPDSSVIFAVFKAEPGYKEANNLGLFGKKGMVALRGLRLEERWGRRWSDRFTSVRSANMAETTENYEKLLAGIDDRDDDDTEELPATAVP